jgi:hypothetical protein
MWRRRGTALAALAPLAVGAVLLSHPLPAAAAPAAAAPAAPAPTDPDACKGGGWRDWEALAPFFKNQGDCVSYVTHLDDSVPGTVDPAATPELGSLVLFGSGATGLAGYAWTRVRAGRSGRRDDASDAAPGA